ncbi:choice-of-anchor C family protein [Streptantibioticus rubrisoli]|uniref:Choice-of-anchor C family protein n=1 Tax=Streptantibioticus rubrisoli TaxID=1387313 RepID=A0ABT1PIV4_9ACTN|nr:choice-of-anchor C family protein [Streptantibioticus rubrisoli]MCQ4045294.1 choice-of-anchor C family protein [Streptantibioticus rubrisoli]
MAGRPRPEGLGSQQDGAPAEPPDEELIRRARKGDDAAFGLLYQRHFGPACCLARLYAPSPADAEDMASEGFTQVLGAIRAGGGPKQAFRPYLLTVVRRIATNAAVRGKRSTPTPEVEDYACAVPFEDPVLADLEASMVGRAFAALPERWQTVLWHTEVEEESPAEVAPRLGLSANAVAALACRAREGLRKEYLQAHLPELDMDHECRKCASKLAAYLRGSLAERHRRRVEEHLARCERCTGLLVELREVSDGLRGILAPLLLGPAFAGYFASLVGTGPAHGSPGRTGRTSQSHNRRWAWRRLAGGKGARVAASAMGVSMASGLFLVAVAASVLPPEGSAARPHAEGRVPVSPSVPPSPSPSPSPVSPGTTPSEPLGPQPGGSPGRPHANPSPVASARSAKPSQSGVSPSAPVSKPPNPTSVVFDGDFETPVVNAPVVLYRAGQFIGPWQVAQGSVNITRSDAFQAADGKQSIDLNGDPPAPINGALAQTFNTTAGQHYIVSFFFAGNFTCAPAIKTMTLQAAQTTSNFTFDTTGHSANNMGWRPETVRFTATGARSTVRFISTTDPNSRCGPTIDGVKVVPA